MFTEELVSSTFDSVQHNISTGEVTYTLNAESSRLLEELDTIVRLSNKSIYPVIIFNIEIHYFVSFTLLYSFYFIFFINIILSKDSFLVLQSDGVGNGAVHHSLNNVSKSLSMCHYFHKRAV